MTSNLDDLDDLEESRVDDNVSCGSFEEYFTDLSPQNMLAMWSLQDVLNWLDENKLGSLVQTFRIHKIDGKELDRIREKNDSKVSRAK